MQLFREIHRLCQPVIHWQTAIGVHARQPCLCASLTVTVTLPISKRKFSLAIRQSVRLFYKGNDQCFGSFRGIMYLLLARDLRCNTSWHNPLPGNILLHLWQRGHQSTKEPKNLQMSVTKFCYLSAPLTPTQLKYWKRILNTRRHSYLA